jgi:hypothetical protein
MSRMSAIKVIDHALTGQTSSESAHHVIQIMGLGTIFTLLMQKGAKKYKKCYPAFSQKYDGNFELTKTSISFQSLHPCSRTQKTAVY